MFLEISPNSQENICTSVSFIMKLQASKKETLTEYQLLYLTGSFHGKFDDMGYIQKIITSANTDNLLQRRKVLNINASTYKLVNLYVDALNEWPKQYPRGVLYKRCS